MILRHLRGAPSTVHSPARRASRRAGLAVAVALSAAAALPQAASAGTYAVESCRDGAGGALTFSAWRVQRLRLRRAGFDATDGCASGDAERGVLRGNRTLARNAGAQFAFRAPGNTTLTRLVFKRELQTAPDIAYQLYALVGAAQRAVPLERCFGKGCATVSARGGVDVALPNGTRAVIARLSCRPSGDRICARRADKRFAQLRITRTVVTVEDIRSPVFVHPPQGPLTSSEPGQSGRRKLKIDAADAGGGLKSLALVLDGKEVAIVPFSRRVDSGCGAVLAGRASCPNRSQRSFDIDTALLANGAHELVLRLRDAAGNQVDSAPLLITTNNPTAPGVFTRLTAGLGTSSENARLPSRKLRYGTPATLAGFVTNAAGAGMPNVRVRITPRIGGPKGSARAVIETTTDATGRYGIPVPVGPSRSFEVRSFAGEAVSAVTRANLSVAVPVRLRASRRGRRVVRLRGSVPADPRPAQGVLVDIQAKSGKRYFPFRVLRTDPRGNFSLTYRFRGRGTFRVRAVVKQQGGLPFATGRSTAHRFRVR